MGNELPVHRADLPQLYRAASDRARSAERMYAASTAAGLVMLIVGAVAGLVVIKRGPADWAGVVALIAFGIAVMLRMQRLITRPDQIWYQGRAIAEGVKSQAWRYLAGGDPYPVVPGGSSEADDQLAIQLAAILTEAQGFPFVETQKPVSQISPAMREIRAAAFQVRTETYVKERLQGQQKWYEQHAKRNRRIRRAWNSILVLFEIVGVGAGLVKALGLVSVDLLGLAGTIVGAGTSWLQVRQYTALEQRYAYSAHELAILQIRLDSMTEAGWPAFVAQVEAVLAEEHKEWLASRRR